MKNLIQKTISVLAVVGLVFAFAPAVHANYSINTASNDCKTVNIGNYTTGAGISDPCWTQTSLTANVGDVVNIAIYYHNSGNSNADNVSFKLNDVRNQTVSQNGSTSFTGSVLVNGSVVSSGIVTLNVNGGPATLQYGQVMDYTQSSGVNSPVSNGSDIFGSSGLSLGTLPPGWNNQGVIKISFTLVGGNTCTNCNNNGQVPNVSTYNVSNLNSNGGSATLNGYYNSNGYNTTTWFQYRQNGGAWINTASQYQGVGSGNMTAALSNLPSGTYDYEAAAQNQYGTVYGSDVSFTIGNTSSSCGVGYSWNGYSCVPITQTCGTGYTWNGYSCVQNVQTCSYGYTWNGYSCVQNVQTCSYGYTWNGYSCVQNVQTCSAGYVWNGSTCIYQNVVTNNVPSISTLGTISVGGTAAAIDGYYNSSSCSVTTYFNYGTTRSLGSTTPSVIRGIGTGSMAQALTNLSPNTTYYYQAVGQNCAGTNQGTVNSFTTTGTTTNDTTIVHYVSTITNNGGSGNSFIALTIDNHRSVVPNGVQIPYDITWKNISGSTLTNLVLEVNFPKQMNIVDTTLGSIEPAKSSVVYSISSLAPNETGSLTVTGQVSSGMVANDPVVAQAVMAFANPKSNATDNAIAYDADTFSISNTSVLGASIFGLGFLPNSLIGWLILILILIAIIVLVRHFMRQNATQTTTVIHNASAPVPPAAPQAPMNIPVDTGASQDYTVYRPTPKQ